MRKLALSVAGASLLMGASFASAQELPDPTLFCGDLSEADCTLFVQSSTTAPNSATSEFSFNINVTGLEEQVPFPFDFTITGSTAYSGGQALQALTDTYASMASAEEIDLGPILQTFLTDFDGSLNLTLTVPQQLVGMLMPGLPNVITLDLAMVDGVGYINFDELQSLGMLPPSLTGWAGIDFAQAFNEAYAEDPTQFTTSVDEVTGASGMSMNMDTTGMDPAEMEALINQVVPYVTVTRTDDGTGDVATFLTDLDFAGMFSSDAFFNMVMEQQEAQGGEELTEAQMAEARAMMQNVFANSSLTYVTSVGIADGVTRSVEFSLLFDLTTLSEQMDGAAPVVAINLTSNTTDVDSTTVTAPAGATVYTTEEFQALLSGGSN